VGSLTEVPSGQARGERRGAGSGRAAGSARMFRLAHTIPEACLKYPRMRPTPILERPLALRDWRIRRALARHAMTLIQMDEDFPWTLVDGCSQGRAGHREDRRPRYRFNHAAAGLWQVAPDFHTIRSIRRLGSSAAAFTDRVANIAAPGDQVDAAAMFHPRRSYCGFQPRPIPFDMRLLAIQS
jgi:hypothetical protein